MFQNLRANNQLFILHKEENPLVDIGSVVSVSAPKPKYPMPTPIGQIPQMEIVVDVVVCVNGQNTTFHDLPAGADIADFGQNGNIVISCSREAMNSEVSAIRQKSLDELNRRNYHENVIAGCDKILTILNPEFAGEAKAGAGDCHPQRADVRNEQKHGRPNGHEQKTDGTAQCF